MPNDNKGNELYRKGNTIYLQLNQEPHPRRIGKINIEGRYLEVRRESEKHLFRKNNSYGFNEQVLRIAATFDRILLIEDEVHKFMIPLPIIFKEGTYLNFAEQGFELQIFLNKNIIQQYEHSDNGRTQERIPA